MKRFPIPTTLAALAVLAAGCSDDTVAPVIEAPTLEFSFQSGAEGWSGSFVEYPAGEEEFYQLQAEHRRLPAPLDTSRGAFFLGGSNRSDDLFMYLTRPVEGLRPDTEYRAAFTVQLATNAGSGCVGIGGAPGESVYVKAGAFGTEPVRVVRDGFYQLSVDKGVQSSGAPPAVEVIGDVANGSDNCSGDAAFRLKTLQGEVRAHADSAGRIWLLVGTDSGFEGITHLYYTRIEVELEAV